MRSVGVISEFLFLLVLAWGFGVLPVCFASGLCFCSVSGFSLSLLLGLVLFLVALAGLLPWLSLVSLLAWCLIYFAFQKKKETCIFSTKISAKRFEAGT